MPPAVVGFGSSLLLTAGAVKLGGFIATFLINVALGALQFRDEDGELWVAVDE